MLTASRRKRQFTYTAQLRSMIEHEFKFGIAAGPKCVDNASLVGSDAVSLGSDVIENFKF